MHCRTCLTCCLEACHRGRGRAIGGGLAIGCLTVGGLIVLAGRLRLGQAWALRLDLLSGGAVVRPVVSLAEHDVAAWGRLFVAGLAGGEIRF